MFATVIDGLLRQLDTSVGGSGPHDFAVRKGCALVSSAACVHRIPPRVRDDREPPLCGTRPNRNIPDSTWPLSEIRIFRNRSPPRPGSVKRRGAENSALRPPAGFVMRQFAVAKPDRHGMVRTNARRYQRSSVTCRNATLSWPSDAAARALPWRRPRRPERLRTAGNGPVRRSGAGRRQAARQKC